MNRFTAIIIFMTFCSVAMNAQAKLFNSGDKVIVQISPNYGKVYVHEMNAQQTVYSLAKAFDQRMQDIESVNPGINFNAMNVGQKIRVPFLAASMIKNPANIIKGEDYVNVYYKVRPKDNLYRISKVYFDTSIENLMEINKTSSMDLKVDDLIKVGWMPIGNTPKARPNQYNYTVTTKTKTETPTTKVQPQATVPAPAPSSTTVVASEEPAKKTNRTERTTSRKKAKKEGFFARVFGNKNNKKKQREEKEIKEVVQLSDQLEKPTESVASANPSATFTPSTTTTAPTVTKPETTIPSDQPKFEGLVEVPEENIDLKEKPEAEPAYIYKSDRGIAIWNQTSTNSKNMFALHPTAKVGSYIEITNPMMNKTVQAKVIGNIPPRTYTDDVSIVVSPRVATMLGVVDRRFAVKVKYREE